MIVATPSLSIAKSVEMSGLVPVCNTKIGNDGMFTDPCGFEYLMTMLNYIISWFTKYFATPVFALLILYAGWLFISDMGSMKNRGQAKKMIMSALVGYVIVLAAWLIINTIMKSFGFTGENYLTNYK